MLTIACVLKSGGDYWPEHVAALRDGVARNLSLSHRFLCLTDLTAQVEEIAGVEAIRLRHNWPGWWSKIELWRPGVVETPAVFFDLDTIIVGPLDDIVLGHRFTVLQSFWAAKYNEPNRIGSGVMAWSEDLSEVYWAFAKSPDRFIREYRTHPKWGDQGFIKDHSPVPMDRWQFKHPGKVVSFKLDCLPLGGVPKGASVVAFHGLPRPWGISANEMAWFEAEAA